MYIINLGAQKFGRKQRSTINNSTEKFIFSKIFSFVNFGSLGGKFIDEAFLKSFFICLGKYKTNFVDFLNLGHSRSGPWPPFDNAEKSNTPTSRRKFHTW